MGDLGLCTLPCPTPASGRALRQLSRQRCLEEEYTGAPQPSEASLVPTLAGEDPKEAPEHPASCSHPTLVYGPELLGAVCQRCLSRRAEGAEGSHAPGAAGTSEALPCLLQPQVNPSSGPAGQGGQRVRPLLAHCCSFLFRQQPVGSSSLGLRPRPCPRGTAGVWTGPSQRCLPAPPPEGCPRIRHLATTCRWGRKLQGSPGERPASTPASSATTQAST